MVRKTFTLLWETEKSCESTDDDGWGLFNTAEDFSMAHELAEQHPGCSKTLKDLFLQEAIANGVFPLDCQKVEQELSCEIYWDSLLWLNRSTSF